MLHFQYMSKKRRQVHAVIVQKKIVALDVGTKYIGLALGTPSIKAAFPYEVIMWNGDEEILKKTLTSLLQDISIELFVIGHVLTHKNEKVEGAIKKVEHILADLYERPICFVDESVTTQEAENRLASIDEVSTEELKQRKDAIAAQIILERYFDSLQF